MMLAVWYEEKLGGGYRYRCSIKVVWFPARLLLTSVLINQHVTISSCREAVLVKLGTKLQGCGSTAAKYSPGGNAERVCISQRHSVLVLSTSPFDSDRVC